MGLAQSGHQARKIVLADDICLELSKRPNVHHRTAEISGCRKPGGGLQTITMNACNQYTVHKHKLFCIHQEQLANLAPSFATSTL